MTLFILLALATGCAKDEVRTTFSGTATSGTLTGSATAVLLDVATLEDEAIKFTHTASDFGFKAAVVYSLQFAPKGTDFATPREFVLPNGAVSRAYSGQDFNNMLLAFELPTNQDSEVEVRLKSAVSDEVVLYSNVLTVTSRPIDLAAAYSWVYVPGDYQGWDPATADSLVSVLGDDVYTGLIAFPSGQLNFKIAPGKSSNGILGDAGDGATLTSPGSNILAPSAGLMQVTVNLNDNTYTVAPADVWSVFGNVVPGTNWNELEDDRDMKYVNDGKGNWEITLNLIAGEFKFRRNHDWATNLGVNSSGEMIPGGGNLKMVTEAGNYTIRVNPEERTYEVVKND